MEVGDPVTIRTGTFKGEQGVITKRTTYTAFGRKGLVFEVDFKNDDHTYNVQFQADHLEWIIK